MARTWTAGDSSGSTTLTDSDHLYPAHINELRTEVDASATVTGEETLTNKTLTSPVVNTPTITTPTISSPTINVTSDAQGDILYRAASGALARLAPGTSGQLLQTGGAAANPSWVTASTVPNAWTSYNPAWTSDGTAPAIGDGTLAGYYVQMGKTVHFKIRFVPGASTTFGTGTYSWALPAAATDANYWACGQAMANDQGTAHRVGIAKIVSTTTIQVWGHDSVNGWGQTVPNTWANGDSIYINGTYEAA